MGRVIGIDLGTSNSVVSYFDEVTQKGECILNKEGVTLTASAVCFHDKEHIRIGNTARECQILYPETTATLFKRKMGIEKTAITVDGDSYSPQQLSAFVLKSLKEDAEEEFGESVDQAVITVPAYFNDSQRQATKEAGMLAGLEVLDLLDEPLAAACHANVLLNYDNKGIIVYDLGGGTLDVLYAYITRDSINERVISGDINCGGSDWTKALIQYIKTKKLNGVSLDIEAEQELANKAELAMKALSSKEETQFTLMTSKGRIEIKVTRAEFEACTADWLRRAMKVLSDMKETLEGMGIHTVDQIILCGGATRMPQIERGIREIYPDVEIYAKDHDQAVAKGAACYCKMLQESRKPEIIRSNAETRTELPIVKKVNRVTSRSYGISVITSDEERKVYNMVFQNEQLPTSREEVFHTRYDNQKTVLLEVFESVTSKQYEEIGAASSVGKCILSINGNLPKHSPLMVNVRVEENGTLYIHGYEESGCTEVEAYMETKALLTPEELIAEREQVEDVYEHVV